MQKPLTEPEIRAQLEAQGLIEWTEFERPAWSTFGFNARPAEIMAMWSRPDRATHYAITHGRHWAVGRP
jgi:hypothetical protein